MKPRLKIMTSGEVRLLQHGLVGWDEWSAKRFIRQKYGSLQAFALRFNLPYFAVCNAVRDSRFERTAGPTSDVRKLLGLKSNPTSHSINLSLSQRGRREKRATACTCTFRKTEGDMQ